jgi:hypothetical protein
MTKCSYFECKKSNTITAFLTVDAYNVRWYCEEHWQILSFLFNSVVLKCIKAGKCSRNYKREFDPDSKTITTVKFCSKYFDLCSKHNDIYEELAGINSLFGYTND